MSQADRTQDLMNLISTNAGSVDGAQYDAPSEVSSEQIAELRNRLDDTDIAQKQNMTNNAELVAVLANRPHTTKYIRDVMGIDKVEATTEGHRGKEYALYIPDKPRVGFDGYRLRTPDNQVLNLRKDEAKGWLMENTLGRVVGGNEGRALTLAPRTKRDSSGLNSKTVVIVKTVNIDTSNPDHYIETFEPAKDPSTGEMISREVSVTLAETFMQPKKGSDKEREVRVRGLVKGFPVWTRKQEFLTDLGPIKQASSGDRLLKVENPEDVEEAVQELLRLSIISGVDVV